MATIPAKIKVDLEDLITDCGWSPAIRVKRCSDYETIPNFVTNDANEDYLTGVQTIVDGVPTIVWYKMDWTVYVGPIKKGNVEKVDVKSEDLCIDGSDFAQTSLIDIEDPNNPAVYAIFYQDITGAVVADPTAGATTVTKGVCGISSNIISAETISGTWSLTNTVPAGSKYAVAQILSWEVYFTIDGSTPTVWSAYMVCEWQEVTLQTEDEVTNFAAISGVDPATIYITYSSENIL